MTDLTFPCALDTVLGVTRAGFADPPRHPDGPIAWYHEHLRPAQSGAG